MNKILKRCSWCGSDSLYVDYHDKEWGKQVKDDQTLFEFLILESAQAGLSWITILRRRDHYKRVYANFDVEKVASFSSEDIERILKDEGVIRNRLKVMTSVTNAQLFIKVQEEFGSFYRYLYSFMPNQEPIINNPTDMSGVPVSTEISDKIAKDMKKRGFKFFGTTICYAYMQAVGMVNDHFIGCEFK